MPNKTKSKQRVSRKRVSRKRVSQKMKGGDHGILRTDGTNVFRKSDSEIIGIIINKLPEHLQMYRSEDGSVQIVSSNGAKSIMKLREGEYIWTNGTDYYVDKMERSSSEIPTLQPVPPPRAGKSKKNGNVLPPSFIVRKIENVPSIDEKVKQITQRLQELPKPSSKQTIVDINKLPQSMRRIQTRADQPTNRQDSMSKMLDSIQKELESVKLKQSISSQTPPVPPPSRKRV